MDSRLPRLGPAESGRFARIVFRNKAPSFTVPTSFRPTTKDNSHHHHSKDQACHNDLLRQRSQHFRRHKPGQETKGQLVKVRWPHPALPRRVHQQRGGMTEARQEHTMCSCTWPEDRKHNNRNIIARTITMTTHMKCHSTKETCLPTIDTIATMHTGSVHEGSRKHNQSTCVIVAQDLLEGTSTVSALKVQMVCIKFLWSVLVIHLV